MTQRFRFNRMELAGSLGDLGTLLPIAIAMVVINGLDPLGIFFSVGLFYILAGVYFGVTVPVQPMKVIGAYAIATSMSPTQLSAATLLMGAVLLIVGLTGIIDLIRRFTPKPVIRGIQLSTGILLISGGIRFVVGTSTLQSLRQLAEPYLTVQAIGPLPIGLLIGAMAGLATMLLLDNRRFPAGLVVVLGGLLVGGLLGNGMGLHHAVLGFNLPEILPFGFPAKADFTFALLALVLPQLPMTLGNAVLAYADLSKDYFGDAACKITPRSTCVSMALANLLSFGLGGMPLCHGAGGLAAHHRFGARTAGSNLIIGVLFVLLALILGDRMVVLLNLLPMSILGVLLIFAGLQLALTLMDLQSRKDYFVAFLILGITLASNLAAGFIIGLGVAHLMRWRRLSV